MSCIPLWLRQMHLPGAQSYSFRRESGNPTWHLMLLFFCLQVYTTDEGMLGQVSVA